MSFFIFIILSFKMTNFEKSSGPWKDVQNFETSGLLLLLDDNFVNFGNKAREFFSQEMQKIDGIVDEMKRSVANNQNVRIFLGHIMVILSDFYSMTIEMERKYPAAFLDIETALVNFTNEYFERVINSLDEYRPQLIDSLKKAVRFTFKPYHHGQFQDIILAHFGTFVRDIYQEEDPVLRLIMTFWNMSDNTQDRIQPPRLDVDELQGRDLPREFRKLMGTVVPRDGEILPRIAPVPDRRTRLGPDLEPVNTRRTRLGPEREPVATRRTRLGDVEKTPSSPAPRVMSRYEDVPEGVPMDIVETYGGEELGVDSIKEALTGIKPPKLKLPTVGIQRFVTKHGKGLGLALTREFARYEGLFEYYRARFNSFLPDIDAIRDDLRTATQQLWQMPAEDYQTIQLVQRVEHMVTRVGNIRNIKHGTESQFLEKMEELKTKATTGEFAIPFRELKRALKKVLRIYIRLYNEFRIGRLAYESRILFRDVSNYTASRSSNVGKVGDKYEGPVVSIKDENLYGSFVALQQSGKSGDELSNEISEFKSQISNTALGRKERRKIGSALNGLIDRFSKANRLTEGGAKSLKL